MPTPAKKRKVTRRSSSNVTPTHRATTAVAQPTGQTFRWIVLGSGVLAVLTIIASRTLAWPADEPSINLFVRYDGLGSIPLVLAALVAFALSFDDTIGLSIRDLVREVGRRPERAALIFAVLAAVVCLPVYRNTALSYDEYAEVFQARVFSRLHWFAQFPPGLTKRLTWPTSNYFLTSGSDGRVFETYWPGFALLLAPFSLLHLGWLLNPILGGAVLWLTARCMKEAALEPETIGWAILFFVASPVLWANSVSFYSMNARLLANLAFAYFLSRSDDKSAWLAGLCGGFACFAHNPFHHLVFALPWWFALLRRPDPRRLLRIGLGYVPFLALGGGWAYLVAHWQGWQQSTTVWDTKAIVEMPLVDDDAAHFVALNFLKMNAWFAPGLFALSVIGFLRTREVLVRRLGFSFLSTYLVYALIPTRWAQGLGWGHRYSYGAVAALPILAALGLRALCGTGEKERRAALVLVAGGLLIAVPMRFAQMRQFIDERLAQAACLPENVKQVCFIKPTQGFQIWDRIQNDPFLESPRTLMLARWPAIDATLMAKHYPTYLPVIDTPGYQVWTPRP